VLEDATMAALLLLLAIVGATVVGDLVLENTGTGAVTLLNHQITGYSDGCFWPWPPLSGSSLVCWWSGR